MIHDGRTWFEHWPDSFPYLAGLVAIAEHWRVASLRLELERQRMRQLPTLPSPEARESLSTQHQLSSSSVSQAMDQPAAKLIDDEAMSPPPRREYVKDALHHH